MEQMVQIRVALCEDLVQRRAKGIAAKTDRIKKIALTRAVRTHQNSQWTKGHIASGNTLVVLQNYPGYSALSCHDSPGSHPAGGCQSVYILNRRPLALREVHALDHSRSRKHFTGLPQEEPALALLTARRATQADV
jgi:post-segregation antitoxin (ccd killing protein)